MGKIVFDFDGTLTDCYVPRYKLISDAGIAAGSTEFFDYADRMVKQHGVNQYEALYMLLFDSMRKLHRPPTEETFCDGAGEIGFHAGVVDCLERLSRAHELYVLSCGYREYILHTAVAPYITEAFGTTFMNLGTDKVSVDYLLDDGKKIEVLDSIASGSYDGLIYVGDGPTDICVFKHIISNGGKAIFVYPPGDPDALSLLSINGLERIPAFPADYRGGTSLSKYICSTLK